MRRLQKSAATTWSRGSQPSYLDNDLDHVYASTNFSFTNFGAINGEDIDVKVRGWVNLDNTEEKDEGFNEIQITPCFFSGY